MLMVENSPKEDKMKNELKELIKKIEKIIDDLMDVSTGILETEIKYMIDLTVAEKMLKLAMGNIRTAKDELESLMKTS